MRPADDTAGWDEVAGVLRARRGPLIRSRVSFFVQTATATRRRKRVAGCTSPSPQPRLLSDRRSSPTPMFSRYTWRGGRRRRGGRRPGEDASTFVDMHGGVLFAIVSAVATLNFLDAWFTVYFISYGGMELNPIVDQLLLMGTWPFILAKSIGIGVCVAVLTVTKNFLIAKIGLGIVLVGYSALLGWHLYLLGHIPV